MKKLFLFSIVTGIMLTSCKKKKDTCVTNMTSIAGTYKLTSLRYKPSGGTETEILAQLPACQRDDLQVLNANGTYSNQDAGTVCSPNGSFTGDWTLTGNTIEINGRMATIQSFDCTTLIFYSTNVVNAGDKQTSTFVRQ